MSDNQMQTIPEAPELEAPEFEPLLRFDEPGRFTWDQVQQLLRGINEKRVLADGKGKAYLAQQDVTAHLIRVFGFGGFDTEIQSVELVFEENAIDKQTKEPNPNRWNVCYRAVMELTVKDPDGRVVARYQNGSTGDATNQTRADGHDLAMKSAISLAMKRCAINLGDQFGLSLYNRGQVKPIVIATKVLPDAPEEAPEDDVQEGVDQVHGDGDDTVREPDPHGTGGEESQDMPPLPHEWATMVRRAEKYGEEATLIDLAAMAANDGNHEARARILGALTRVQRRE